jgi:hypothetical protein
MAVYLQADRECNENKPKHVCRLPGEIQPPPYFFTITYEDVVNYRDRTALQIALIVSSCFLSDVIFRT